jgi:hypothetical protein
MKRFTDGVVRAVYWPGNEKLKGDELPLPPLPAPPTKQQRESYYPGVVLKLRASVVVEAQLSCADRRTRAGFVLSSGNQKNASRSSSGGSSSSSSSSSSNSSLGGDGGSDFFFSNAFVWDCATQRFSIGPLEPSNRQNFTCGPSSPVLDGQHKVGFTKRPFLVPFLA